MLGYHEGPKSTVPLDNIYFICNETEYSLVLQFALDRVVIIRTKSLLLHPCTSKRLVIPSLTKPIPTALQILTTYAFVTYS